MEYFKTNKPSAWPSPAPLRSVNNKINAGAVFNNPYTASHGRVEEEEEKKKFKNVYEAMRVYKDKIVHIGFCHKYYNIRVIYNYQNNINVKYIHYLVTYVVSLFMLYKPIQFISRYNRLNFNEYFTLKEKNKNQIVHVFNSST